MVLLFLVLQVFSQLIGVFASASAAARAPFFYLALFVAAASSARFALGARVKRWGYCPCFCCAAIIFSAWRAFHVGRE